MCLLCERQVLLIQGARQFLVALVISELGTRIPLAGYSYQWGSRLVNSTYGWFVGFTGLCYLSVGGAGITYVVVREADEGAPVSAMEAFAPIVARLADR